MDRFVFNIGNKKYSIDVENYKFLIGDNHHDKFNIYDVIKSTFGKITNSEFAFEKHYKHEMTFNEKYLDLKNWRYFEVTPFYDLESDMKIGSKSLIGKYLDSLACDLEQNDVFNTMTILINSLNEDFFGKDTVVDFGNKQFKFQLSTVTRSTIAKEIISSITEEDAECNSADLNYEEILLLQIKLIEKIAYKNKDKLIFVYCNIPYMTPKIELALIGIRYKGCYIIVDTMHAPRIEASNCAVCSKHYLDFANREMILDKIMDFPFHVLPDELFEIANKCFLSQKYDSGNKAIAEIFPWEI